MTIDALCISVIVAVSVWADTRCVHTYTFFPCTHTKKLDLSVSLSVGIHILSIHTHAEALSASLSVGIHILSMHTHEESLSIYLSVSQSAYTFFLYNVRRSSVYLSVSPSVSPSAYTFFLCTRTTTARERDLHWTRTPALNP